MLLELELRVQTGTHALASVVSVLHARRTRVERMTYTAGEDEAVLVLRCEDGADVQRLAAQLDRRVDVTAVTVRRARTAA